MLILVQCPRCQNRYQLDASLRGQAVRCPNAACSQIFRLPEGDPAAPVPPAKASTPPLVVEGSKNAPPARGPGRAGSTTGPAAGKQISGSVGNVIPLLAGEEVNKGPQPGPGSTSAPTNRSSGNIQDFVTLLPSEAAPSAQPPVPRDAPSWQQQAPPIRNLNPPANLPRPALAPELPPTSTGVEPVREAADWRQQPPPPRQGGTGSTANPPPRHPPAESAPAHEPVNWQQQPPPPRVPGVANSTSPPAPPAPKAGAETMRIKPVKAETMRILPVQDPPDTQRVLAGKDTHPGTADVPVELPAGAWQSPPVRQVGPAMAADTLTSPLAPLEPSAAAKSRRARWIMIGLALLVGTFMGTGLWIFKKVSGRTEDKLFQQAQQNYKDGNYPEALKIFRDLEKEFPSSAQLPTYKFYAELSTVRDAVYSRPARPQDTTSAYQRLTTFVADHHGEELLQQSQDEIRDTYYKLVRQFTDWARDKADARMVVAAEKALAQARHYQGGRDAQNEAEELLAQVTKSIRKQGAQLGFLDRLKELLRRPSSDAIRQAADLIREAERNRPEVRTDPEVIERLNALAAAHRARVKYTAVTKSQPARVPAEDSAPSLLVAPGLGEHLGFKPWPKQSPVLALARGVLYALRPSDGSVRWATRVGIDTSVLPVRLAAFKTTPEIILVFSSDTNTLSALRADRGDPVWHRPLTAPCLARPTVVESRLFVPCYNGRVDEIDVETGKLIGYYELGQPLSLSAVYDEDSHFLYVPADACCVYVLNLRDKARPCSNILYTEHPSGSLRCDPVLIRWKDVPPDAPRHANAPHSCLLLCQADGLEATELRAYPLPLPKAEANPEQASGRVPGKPAGPALLFPSASPLRLQLRVRGWSWFAPSQDDEKLALATDAAVLGLFGIKQKNNRDKPLFPMRDQEWALAKTNRTAPTQSQGRAQVVYFDESNFWVLAHGELHRLRIALGPRGWQMKEMWSTPIPLGSPLHAAQVDPARKILFLVTQPSGGQVCLASAVDAEAEAGDKDKVKWQRQLGLLCRGDPVAWQNSVLALDQRGGLFRFDAPQYKDAGNAAWYIHEQVTAGPLEDDEARPLQLLPVPGGAYVLIALGKEAAGKLIIRHYDAASTKLTDHPCTLTARLAGTPGAWPDHVVFPVHRGTTGILMRKQIPGGPPVAGLDWKAKHADDNAPGHVVPLNATDFLVSDGSTGLLHMSWPKDDDNCMNKAEEKVPARIVAPPVVLFAKDNPREFRVFVADADNHVNLLRGELKGRLEKGPRLALDGKITAGPFLLGQGIGCIVDDRRLVLLDGADNHRLWQYSAQAAIVGRPVLMAGVVIVADLQGNLIGLDPATGKPQGRGYRLKANVAPAAAPVPFGSDRVFVPLTDGTVLLLPLDKVRTTSKKKQKQ